ncbi:hypothetical protein DFH09DRAFT_1125797 [Mycena vulgaris]|nr:hypothetical protein DFH09DRAFT_1125797 [Mycena vulgaris]
MQANSASLGLSPYITTAGSTILVPAEHEDEGTTGRRALIIRAFLNPAPGRTLNEVYSLLGRVLETKANRAAHRLGIGPHGVAQTIMASFGTGETRQRKLADMRSERRSSLVRRCCQLIKYALPIQAPKTQSQAFRCIVNLATLLPGLRPLFLRSKYIQNVPPSPTQLSALWSRPHGPPDGDWTFWQSFAAHCLSDDDICGILEGSYVPQLTNCQPENGGLSVIERLLIAHNCERLSLDFSSALCIRYLGGILDLPGFWLDMGNTHQDVAKKLCVEVVHMLEDVGADLRGRLVSGESDVSFDSEGLDFLTEKVLVGVSNWFHHIDTASWCLQPWYAGFRTIVQLLRSPYLAELLPISSARAFTEAVGGIIPSAHHIGTVQIEMYATLAIL